MTPPRLKGLTLYIVGETIMKLNPPRVATNRAAIKREKARWRKQHPVKLHGWPRTGQWFGPLCGHPRVWAIDQLRKNPKLITCKTCLRIRKKKK